MAIRFRRSIKIAPGVRWNISSGGSSFTVGPRGASINVGQRGAYANTSLPGTGLSSRSRLAAPPRRNRMADLEGASKVQLTCAIGDDGALRITDAQGQPVTERWMEIAKKQNREEILELIQRKCDDINADIAALGQMHLSTPDCRRAPVFTAARYTEPAPEAPTRKTAGFFARLVGAQTKFDRAYEADRVAYEARWTEWQSGMARHDQEQGARRSLIEEGILTSVAAMETYLEERLAGLEWPRETRVAFEIADGGATVRLDVDLPELEDMPHQTAGVPQRGLKLYLKEMPAAKVQSLYLEHVHGLLFRLVGESFAALPKVSIVVASGYTQRADPGTGVVTDDYVLSVRVQRERWQTIDFNALEEVDVVEALRRFECRGGERSKKRMATIAPFE